MKIIKRNGSEETFDIQKIVVAVTKADKDNGERTLTDSQIEDIAEYVEFKCNKLNRAVSVEEIHPKPGQTRRQVFRLIQMHI